MKKILLVLLVITQALILTSCGEKIPEITAETEITMDNLDEYLFREDVQYVDLRNHEAIFKWGYIDGFESIPFFDYLDYRAFDRERTYDFNPDQLRDTDILFRLFEKDKAILLYADGCIRSGYLKDVLNHLGYERVFVIGGFYEYQGENRVFGDGRYEIGNTFFNEYNDSSESYVYVMYGNFDVAKNIISIKFDIYDYDFNCVRKCIETHQDAMLTIIEEHINNGIYNFNEIIDDLEDENSDISTLEGVDWSLLPQVIYLFEQEYRD